MFNQVEHYTSGALTLLLLTDFKFLHANLRSCRVMVRLRQSPTCHYGGLGSIQDSPCEIYGRQHDTD